MKLVIDTNVILKALIRNSKVRVILLNPNHRFCVPEDAIEETERYLPLIVKKTGLSAGEIKFVLDILLTNIQVIPLQDVVSKWNEAAEIMAPIDIEDASFIAVALVQQSDGIWSDDKHLKRQSRITVWNTKEIIKLA